MALARRKEQPDAGGRLRASDPQPRPIMAGAGRAGGSGGVLRDPATPRVNATAGPRLSRDPARSSAIQAGVRGNC